MLKSMLCIRTQPQSQNHCITSPYYHGNLTAVIPSSQDGRIAKLQSRIKSENRVRWLFNNFLFTITCSYKLATFLYYIFTTLYYGFCLIIFYILWIYLTKLTNQVKLIYHNFSDPYS
ncbi:ORF3b [Hana virus]|uniref:ORF3b n=1 Tax=Hana virus TaxID=1286140 RepID=M4JWS6_9NIDO|nr:ORF3b [Alphamesonivirus 2]AGE00053.1 ORF3b [Hana virus]